MSNLERRKKTGGGSRKGKPNRPKNDGLRQIYESLISSFKTGSSYVYAHIYNGNIFYIGKGSGHRAWDKNIYSRNDYWSRFAREISFEYTVKIISADLSEDEALAIEKALIELHRPQCNILHK